MTRPKKSVTKNRSNIEKARLALKRKREEDGGTEPAASTSQATPSTPSTSQATPSTPARAQPADSSAKKRKKIVTDRMERKESVSVKNLMMERSDISEIVKNMFCDKCNAKDVFHKFVCHQANTSVKFICNNCHHVIYENAKKSKSEYRKDINIFTMFIVHFVIMRLGRSVVI